MRIFSWYNKLTRHWGLLLTLLLSLVFLLLWYQLPLFDIIVNAKSYLQTKDFLNSPYLILAIVGIYFMAGLMFIPINLMIILTATLFNPFMAFCYITVGTQFFCSATYLVGLILKKIKKEPLDNIKGKIQKAVKSNSLATFTLIRVLPIAPSIVIGIVAGYFNASFLKFQVGSGLGIIPGTVALIFFEKSLVAIIFKSEWEYIFVVLIVLILLFSAYKIVKKRFKGYL